MWSEDVILMILNGVKETLYMTLASTILGYVFGLPMGICLAVSDKDGLKPNAVLYKILDLISNICEKHPVSDSFNPCDTAHEIARGAKLRIISNHCSTGGGSSAVYCKNGGIFG